MRQAFGGCGGVLADPDIGILTMVSGSREPATLILDGEGDTSGVPGQITEFALARGRAQAVLPGESRLAWRQIGSPSAGKRE